ncbi:MAG: autotransporter domain-containing protein, partial [Alphaproteobacteria bacterium]
MLAAPVLAQTTNPSATDETASNVVTSQAVVRELSAMTVGGIAARVGGFLSPQLLANQGFDPDRASLFAIGDIGTGMSAGGGDGRLGIWVSGGWSSIEDDFVSTAYDGNLYSVLFGADYQMNDRLLAGIPFGYESSNIDTTFNTGNSE